MATKRNNLATWLLIAAFLHYAGVAAYVYRIISPDYERVFFFNLDRIYLIVSFTLIYFSQKKGITLKQSNKINIAIAGSVIQMLGYLIAVNSKYIISGHKELIWIIFFTFIFIITLLTTYLCRQQLT